MIAYFLTDGAGGMIAHPLTYRALGAGGSHFLSRECPLANAAAVVLHDVTAVLLPGNSIEFIDMHSPSPDI
jgi:hypothetical protein